MSSINQTPAGRTMADKLWQSHLVRAGSDGEPDLLYIDLHLVHEVTSPQAFDGLRLAGRRVRRPELTIATEDHNVPTENVSGPIADPISARQIETMRVNAAEFGITLHQMGSPKQGIVHVIGPEQGLTQPGMTVVCGDSHTATHGAVGALALAPASIDMLQTVIRSSMERAWMADPRYSRAWAVAPPVPIRAMSARIRSLAVTPFGASARSHSSPFGANSRPER